MKMCEKLAGKGLFGESGDWQPYNNTLPQIWAAYSRVLQARKDHPDEPVVLIGYSYGGAAVLELARMLNEDPTFFGQDPVPVDAAVTIDPVTFARGAWRTFGWATDEVSPNVKRTLNLYAGSDQQQPIRPRQGDSMGLGLSTSNSTSGILNGKEHLDGALNVEVADRNGGQTNHFSIMGEQNGPVNYNLHTYSAIRTFLTGKLYLPGDE